MSKRRKLGPGVLIATIAATGSIVAALISSPTKQGAVTSDEDWRTVMARAIATNMEDIIALLGLLALFGLIGVVFFLMVRSD